MSNEIEWDEMKTQISHWLATPSNGYLGSEYGYKDVLLGLMQQPQNDDVSRKIISKIKLDIPYIAERDVNVSWVCGSRSIKISVDSDYSIFEV